MKPWNVSDLAGTQLDAYDIVDVMLDVEDAASVGILNYRTKEIVNAALARFRDTEKRDPSTELATQHRAASWWDSIQWRIEHDIPDGTILFMQKDDYKEWRKAMERAHAIINIGGVA